MNCCVELMSTKKYYKKSECREIQNQIDHKGNDEKK